MTMRSFGSVPLTQTINTAMYSYIIAIPSSATTDQPTIATTCDEYYAIDISRREQNSIQSLLPWLHPSFSVQGDNLNCGVWFIFTGVPSVIDR